jgi:hypothetical protein
VTGCGFYQGAVYLRITAIFVMNQLGSAGVTPIEYVLANVPAPLSKRRVGE